MSSDDDPWLRDAPDGVILTVHVVPGASRACVVGRHGDALRVRVTAPPAGGAANREVVRVLATALEVAVARVAIARGAASRRKLVHVTGVGSERARTCLLGGGSVDTGKGRH